MVPFCSLLAVRLLYEEGHRAWMVWIASRRGVGWAERIYEEKSRTLLLVNYTMSCTFVPLPFPYPWAHFLDPASSRQGAGRIWGVTMPVEGVDWGVWVWGHVRVHTPPGWSLVSSHPLSTLSRHKRNTMGQRQVPMLLCFLVKDTVYRGTNPFLCLGRLGHLG